MRRLRQKLRDALDPSLAPGPVKSFKDMTAAERAELQRLYGAALKSTTQQASGNDSSRLTETTT